MNSEISISSGKFKVVILPEMGGTLAAWQEDGKDLLKPAAKEITSANDTAMYPLVPYSNRIRGGSFIYWGIKRTVPKNNPDVADPLHGEGWIKEWNVVSKTDDSVTLKFNHDGKSGFPFAYEAEQTFTVADNNLTVSLKVRNKGGIPMPCGLGWHPFFAKDADTVAKFKTKTLWAHEFAPPREQPIKTPPEWQFENGLNVNGLELDSCFGGFDGKAEIQYPTRGKKINMVALSDIGHVVVWTPEGQDFFCIEPVTNTTDAFNLASRGVTGTGIKTLDPEEKLSETLTLSVTDL